MTSKHCTGCGERKSLDAYHKGKGRMGCRPACIECSREQRRPAPRGIRRRQNLWTRYRTTPEAVDEMIERQGGKCPLCEQPLPKRYHIDHSHETGEVRGILCHGCNVRIGGLEDPDYRARAFGYLEGGQ